MGEKICTNCKINKNFCEFGKHRGNKRDGLQCWCKSCMNKDDKTRKRTIAGLISRIYQRQKNSSKTRNHIPPSYSNKELLQFALNSDVFISLYDEWVGSEFDRKMTPSFDRLDDSKGYSFENFNEWMTFHENNQKAHADMRSGKLLNSGWFHGGAKPVSCVD